MAKKAKTEEQPWKGGTPSRPGIEPIDSQEHHPLDGRADWSAPKVREIGEQEAALTARSLVRQCRTLIGMVPVDITDPQDTRRQLDGIAALLAEADSVLHLIATATPTGPTAPVPVGAAKPEAPDDGG